MKMHASTVAAIGVLLGLVACGGGPTTPTPVMVILQPRPQAKLKIGTPATISWRCEGCEDVQAEFARVRLNRQTGPGSFLSMGFIAEGFLSDTRVWIVGSDQFIRPGFYFIEVSSYPPPDTVSGAEVSTGFEGVAIEVVE